MNFNDVLWEFCTSIKKFHWKNVFAKNSFHRQKASQNISENRKHRKKMNMYLQLCLDF